MGSVVWIMTNMSDNLSRGFQYMVFGTAMFGFVTACAPTVKVQAPDEPITINLNVKIEHEIRVKVEKDIDNLFSEEGGLF